jgi:hypothetical protein
MGKICCFHWTSDGISYSFNATHQVLACKAIQRYRFSTSYLKHVYNQLILRNSLWNWKLCILYICFKISLDLINLKLQSKAMYSIPVCMEYDLLVTSAEYFPLAFRPVIDVNLLIPVLYWSIGHSTDSQLHIWNMSIISWY